MLCFLTSHRFSKTQLPDPWNVDIRGHTWTYVDIRGQVLEKFLRSQKVVTGLVRSQSDLNQISIRSQSDLPICLQFFATLGVVTLRSKAFAAWRGYIQEHKRQKRQLHQEEFKRNSLWWLFYILLLISLSYFLLDFFGFFWPLWIFVKVILSHFTFWKLEAILKRSDVAPGAANCTARSPWIQATGAFGVRTPRHPETTETYWDHRKQEIVWDCGLWWSMAIYGLWQSMMSMVAAKTPHTFCICRFRHFAFFRHFCLSIWHFRLTLAYLAFLLQSFDLILASLAPTRWTCVHSVHVVRCLIVCFFSTFVCFVHGWRSKGNRFTDLCSLQYGYILVRMACASVYSMTLWHEAPCLISCQQWLSHRFFVDEDFT